jgi:hypothetical protein
LIRVTVTLKILKIKPIENKIAKIFILILCNEVMCVANERMHENISTSPYVNEDKKHRVQYEWLYEWCKANTDLRKNHSKYRRKLYSYDKNSLCGKQYKRTGFSHQSKQVKSIHLLATEHRFRITAVGNRRGDILDAIA